MEKISETYVQWFAHCPARYPLPSSLFPALSHVLRYGDLTARGIAGGRAGENVDFASAIDINPKTDSKMDTTKTTSDLAILSDFYHSNQIMNDAPAILAYHGLISLK
jgi:hypothetical protein